MFLRRELIFNRRTLSGSNDFCTICQNFNFFLRTSNGLLTVRFLTCMCTRNVPVGAGEFSNFIFFIVTSKM